MPVVSPLPQAVPHTSPAASPMLSIHSSAPGLQNHLTVTWTFLLRTAKEGSLLWWAQLLLLLIRTIKESLLAPPNSTGKEQRSVSSPPPPLSYRMLNWESWFPQESRQCCALSPCSTMGSPKSIRDVDLWNEIPISEHQGGSCKD